MASSSSSDSDSGSGSSDGGNVNELDAALPVGASLSLLASLVVLGSFIRFRELRRHPNTLIAWRSVFDLVFSILVIAQRVQPAVSNDDSTTDSCSALAFITQFVLLGSETWFGMLSIDLLFGLTNPFTNYRRNLRYYYFFSFMISLCSSIGLSQCPGARGRSYLSFCWIKEQSPTEVNQYLWAFFYAPVLVIYVFSASVGGFAFFRLRRGLRATYDRRMSVFRRGRNFVAGSFLFWTVASLLYGLCHTESTKKAIFPVFTALFAGKGLVTMVVWLVTYDIVEVWHRDLKRRADHQDLDEDQLEPHLNSALKLEVLHYSRVALHLSCLVTAPQSGGVSTETRSMYDWMPVPLEGHDDIVDGRTVGLHQAVGVQATRRSIPPGTRPPLEISTLAPEVFKQIRALYQISNEAFITSISETVNERFSEGASGAFMALTRDGKYVLKTMSESEAEMLRTILPPYVEFLNNNRETLLTKFLVCASLRLYRQRLFFVVMENVFNTRNTIHERYDLKGSWIGRSAVEVASGQQAFCRYCNEPFKVKADRRACPARPNHRHVPNTVLKDNDLQFKLRLNTKKASRLGAQLRKDSKFLAARGITDYSLIIGVHRRKFNIDFAKSSVLPDESVYGGKSQYRGRDASETSEDDDSTHKDVESSRLDWDRSTLGISALDSTSHRNTIGSIPLPFFQQDEGGLAPDIIEGPGLFYIGIIDVLQGWTWLKRLERLVKVYARFQDAAGISAMAPIEYQERFDLRVITEVIEEHERVEHGVLLVPRPSERTASFRKRSQDGSTVTTHLLSQPAVNSSANRYSIPSSSLGTSYVPPIPNWESKGSYETDYGVPQPQVRSSAPSVPDNNS